MTALSVAEVGAARDDVAVFADLVGQPLMDWQASALRLESLISVILGPRQVGKSRSLAILAAWWAFRRPGQVVLIISAGEDTAKRLLAMVSTVMRHELLAGDVVEDGVAQISLSNGSVIRCVPASERQVRGQSVDLLIVDEAAFVSDAIVEGSALPTVTARVGSGARVVFACTAWTSSGAFYRFAVRGEAGVDPEIRTFRWPLELASTERGGWITPGYLAMMRASIDPLRWRTEFECEFVDGGTGFFGRDLLMANVAAYPLIGPERAAGGSVVLGCDWGNRFDSHALVMLGALDDYGLNDGPVLFLPWLETSQRSYRDQQDWIAYLGKAAPRRNPLRGGWTVTENLRNLWTPGQDRGYRVERIYSESNGVGAMATETLEDLFRNEGKVIRTVTSQQTKEMTFSRLLDALSARILVLPDHPELLRQLTALESTPTGNGGTRIAAGPGYHDDLAMALSFTANVLSHDLMIGRSSPPSEYDGEWLSTESGIKVPARPRPRWGGGFQNVDRFLRADD